MLASITPLGERSKGNHWWFTVTAHILGSLVGGLAVGAVAGTVGWAIYELVGRGPLIALVAIVAVAGVAGDLRRGRPYLPTPRRQVNEQWLTTYRGWVYGVGFGVQLGLGVATIITSGLLHVMLAAAAATASPVWGALVGGVFGLVRGATLLTMAGVDAPATLVSRHRRIQELYPHAQRAAVTTEVLVATAVIAAGIAG